MTAPTENNLYPMGKRNLIILIGVAAVLALVMAFITLVPCIKVLSLQNTDNQLDKFYSKDALKGFSITYTDSSNKGRVRDFYECKSNDFLYTKSVFGSFAGEMPDLSKFEGTNVIVRPYGYEIPDINKTLESLKYEIGVGERHSICYGDKDFFLKNFFKVHSKVEIELKRVSLGSYCITRKLPEE